MSTQAIVRQHDKGARPVTRSGLNACLLVTSLILAGVGIVMIASASLEIAERQLGVPTYFLVRQLCFLILGLLVAIVVLRIPMRFWEAHSAALLLLTLALLVLVLIPGIGREINGSMRWISLGVISFQPSELAKLAVTLYMAGYLVRRSHELRQAFAGFMKPMLVLALLCVLLILEPDFGTVAVLLSIVMAMLFIGGVKIWQFSLLMTVVGLVMAALAVSSPYRLQRITAFMDPWADPFASGFQLTQALIAFGRGEWLGVGLGSSIQKLFYLPEAHTDFLFAVLAEELGLFGVVAIILLFTLLVASAISLARRCERIGLSFSAYLAYGLATWIAVQAMTNMAVNMGLLPTKGLTLPLMSYGGSSLIVMCVVIALLLRMDLECKNPALRVAAP